MTYFPNINRAKSTPYQIFNTYCLRTPLYSISNYLNWIQKKRVTKNDFNNLLKDPVFKEALHLASPELVTQITKWENKLLTDTYKIERLQLTILKYATRIATRCTPFGLFASCNVGNFNSKTTIKLNPLNNYTRVTRFDMVFLALLVKELLKDNNIRQQILFYPNTSLYQVSNQYRYIEYTLKNYRREYSIEGFKYADYFEKIFSTTKKGNTIPNLINILSDNGITKKDAELFINKLIKNQILVSELELKVTGNDFLSDLIQRLPTNAEIISKLKILQLSLIKLDEKYGNSLKDYQNIINKSKNIVQNLDTKYLLQTDSFSSFRSNTLEFNIKKQLKKACLIFNKITPLTKNNNLEVFKKKFEKRYGNNEIPINLVLDIETGIGYGKNRHSNNYFIEKINTKTTTKKHQKIIWSNFDELLFNKYTNAIANQQCTIVLTAQDFNNFSENWNDLPDTFSGIAEVYSDTNKIFINRISGSSATNLLGRFGHGSKPLLTHLNKIVQTENELNPGKILAEIIHLPQSRTGNVLQRPAIRKHEISYLGNANANNSKQISVNDLMVSVKNNQIILRSKKLNKEILPRLGNAHNFKNQSLPLYQFLCDVQIDNLRANLGFYWNTIFLNNSFLPRVEYGNLIFSKARWNIKVSELKDIIVQENTSEKILKWRNQLQIPQYVELVEGDNKLLINMNNSTSVKMLLDAIKNKKKCVFEEFLFNSNGVVNRGNESFCNQFIVSFYNEAKLRAIKKDE